MKSLNVLKEIPRAQWARFKHVTVWLLPGFTPYCSVPPSAVWLRRRALLQRANNVIYSILIAFSRFLSSFCFILFHFWTRDDSGNILWPTSMFLTSVDPRPMGLPNANCVVQHSLLQRRLQ